jgi:hypothetical protein
LKQTFCPIFGLKPEYGNLSEECILKTKKVLYHECISADDMKIKERYLINTLSPEFNISLNNKSRFSFSIEIDWKYLSLNTEKLLEKKEEKKIKHTVLRNISAKVVNVGTKTNVVFGAEISREFNRDYIKFKIGKGLHSTNLIFKINDEIYLALNSFYWHLQNGSPEKGYGKRFDENNKNKYGLLRSDYLNVEIEHFQDIDFVSVFCNIEEQEQAKYKGKPIICKDRKLNEFYSDYYGVYYEDSFTLVKYERLKELFILEKSFIEKIEKYLSLSIGEERQRGNVRTTLRSAKSDEYTEREVR